jgi:integrase
MPKPSLPYVHRFRDRHGKWRYYYRRHGKRIRLPLPDDPDFLASYHRADGSTASAESHVRHGSVEQAIVSYYQSGAYNRLAETTKRLQRSHLERFRARCGSKNIASMPAEVISRLTADLSPHVARNWIKTLRSLMRHATSVGLVQSDPTQNIKLPKTSGDGRHTWTEDEIAVFGARHAIGTKARLAMALGLYTSQRRGDVIRMGRQHIQGDTLTVRQNKTKTTLQIPLHPELQQIIAATPSGHLTLLATPTGRAYTDSGFGNDFHKWCRQAGLPVRCSFHGLRYAMARRLAERGASTHQIASITGHKSLSEVARYTKAVDQARLAREAMRLIGGTEEAKERTANGKPFAPDGNPD